MSNEDADHPRPSSFTPIDGPLIELNGCPIKFGPTTFLQKEKGITGMDFLRYGIRLYRAVLRGDSKTVKSIHNESPCWMSASITKGGETALHIAAAAKHINIVSLLLGILDPASVSRPNNVGNTPLCFAAVSGVVEIAEMMVKKNAELPHIRGSQGMTPLQMAVLLGRKEMVWFLLRVTDGKRLTDEDRIELLTSSIDTDMFDVALYILSGHRYLALQRDTKNETPLHALARRPLRSSGDSKLGLWSRTNRKENKEHEASLMLVERLWTEIIKQKEEVISKLIRYPWRLIFVAAKLGKVEFLKILIQHYPDIIWKVDENKRTIFHTAIVYRHEEIFKLIYEVGAIKDLIATYKDDQENSMVHLAAKLAPSDRLNSVSGAALQMQREMQWFTAVKKIVRPEFTEAKNKRKKTPQALFTEKHKDLMKKGENWMKTTSESCALVAALIATVVFSAAFQLPGGLNNTGSPNLVKSVPFMVYATSNAVSLFSSTSSILMFLSILTSRYAEQDFLISLPLKLMTGLILLMVSIATMIIAFTATFFITFKDGARWVPVPIALIAFIPVALFVFQQYPLLQDIYRSSFIFHRSLLESCNSKLFELSSKPDYVPPSVEYITEPILTNPIDSFSPPSVVEYITEPILTNPIASSSPPSVVEYITEPILTNPIGSSSPPSVVEYITDPILTNPIASSSLPSVVEYITEPILTNPIGSSSPPFVVEYITDPILTNPIGSFSPPSVEYITEPILTNPIGSFSSPSVEYITEPILTNPIGPFSPDSFPRYLTNPLVASYNPQSDLKYFTAPRAPPRAPSNRRGISRTSQPFKSSMIVNHVSSGPNSKEGDSNAALSPFSPDSFPGYLTSPLVASYNPESDLKYFTAPRAPPRAPSTSPGISRSSQVFKTSMIVNPVASGPNSKEGVPNAAFTPDSFPGYITNPFTVSYYPDCDLKKFTAPRGPLTLEEISRTSQVFKSSMIVNPVASGPNSKEGVPNAAFTPDSFPGYITNPFTVSYYPDCDLKKFTAPRGPLTLEEISRTSQVFKSSMIVNPVASAPNSKGD